MAATESFESGRGMCGPPGLSREPGQLRPSGVVRWNQRVFLHRRGVSGWPIVGGGGGLHWEKDDFGPKVEKCF